MSSAMKRLLVNLFLTFIFLYLMSPLGATFNGVVVPDFHILTFFIMGIAVILWGFIRLRKHWQWHVTSLDFTFFLWGIALLISIVANLETMRRSAIGLWYMSVYVGVWYVLHDCLSNRGITRKQLIDALLSAGLLIMLFSYLQLFNAGILIIPVSLIGNPNALGAILLVLIPFSLGRFLNANHRFGRVIWGVYGLTAIINMLLTLSRGAWLGLMGALGLMSLLMLQHHKMLSLAAIRLWWIARSHGQQRILTSILGMIFVTCLIIMGLLINSFSIPARRSELRTRLWNSALMQFAEKPITGQGFYTFGQEYPLSISVPPAQTHSHAHSLPFNILAEMGFIGISVFVLSIGWIVCLIWQRWSMIDSNQRSVWIISIATLFGFGVQHLFDLPSMMPVVALVGLLVLILVCAPYNPQVLTATWRKIGHPIGMFLLWTCVFITGVLSSNIYQQYLDAMRLSFVTVEDLTATEKLANYQITATLLEDVIRQDPFMPIYHQQQAIVWGLAANLGDTNAIDKGINAYIKFLKLVPNHSISWANLSALYWQAGNTDAAITAIQHSIDLSAHGFFAQVLSYYQGELSLDDIVEPEYRYNQDFARYEFLREPLNLMILPQLVRQS